MNAATKQYIEQHLNDDVNLLALKKAPTDVDLPTVLHQIEARQLLAKKVPSWSQNEDLLFPARLAIEQCSSEATATYKASLLGGNRFLDLTGGLGIDSCFISAKFQHADYVERQPELCELARHNFEVLGTNVTVHNAAAEDYLNDTDPVDWIFIDPARRDVYGRKMVSVADCSPDVIQLQDLLLTKATHVMVKLSPMLDITQALSELHHVEEVHVVAVNNECKELILIMKRDCNSATKLFCVNLLSEQETISFTIDEESACPLSLADGVMRYLYEPNAAVMKGGCFKTIASAYGMSKLHRNSHLYTSENLVTKFPGRIFEVRDCVPFNRNSRRLLPQDGSKFSISVRNFPLSAEQLRKLLKLKDGDECYLFATTIKNDSKVLILCKKINDNE